MTFALLGPPEGVDVEPMLEDEYYHQTRAAYGGVLGIAKGECMKHAKSVYRTSQNHPKYNEPILDLLGHGQESLFDVGCILCRSLKERNIQLIREFLE
jgi:hypothetical protein